jgi:hypothetical protein
MVQKNVRKVAGKNAHANIRYGSAGSVASGVEGGDVPQSTEKTAEIISPLKNLYGSFQISDKAIRAAQNNPAAFASLLSGEMQNLISTAQANLNEMLYGNGNKPLAYSTSFDTDNKKFVVPSRFAANFNVGDAIEFYDADNLRINQTGITVSDVTTVAPNTQITYTGTCTAFKYDRLYIYPFVKPNLDMNGIDSIFMPDAIYNLATASYPEILPCIYADTLRTSTLGILNEDEIMNFFDAYEEHCQGDPADILLTHPIVRKAVFENLKDLRSNIDTTELAGGFKGFSFNGIPVYSDIKCKAGTLYALNSDSWNMHELCDWTWLSGDDGGILKQIDGKAGYSATLVKYADLLCDKPFLQGKATGFVATRFS